MAKKQEEVTILSFHKESNSSLLRIFIKRTKIDL